MVRRGFVPWVSHVSPRSSPADIYSHKMLPLKGERSAGFKIRLNDARPQGKHEREAIPELP
jgi:hypothetical protein